MKTLDQIHVRDLLVRGVIGIHDWERKVEQDIVVNLTMWCDLRSVAQADDLGDGLNYRSITKQIIEHIKESQRYTVEALATDIAKLCLDHKEAEKVRVSVEKPGALRFARSVGVEIERERSDFV